MGQKEVQAFFALDLSAVLINAGSRYDSTFKRKLQSRTAAATWRKEIRFQSTESRDSEPPTFAEPAISEIQYSEPLALHSPSDSDSNTGSDGGMPGAWPEWSEAEDEEQESESEECRATEKVVQTLWHPAAEWMKAESLLGSDKVPLSENTKAVWARRDRGKKAAKAADEKRSSLLTTYGHISRFFVTSTPPSQPDLPPNFIMPDFNQSEGGERRKDIADDIFQLDVWVRRISQTCRAGEGSALTLCLGC